MKKVLGLLLIFCCFSFKHPFYLSVTDLKFNPAHKRFEGSVKVFNNDLENALKQIHQKSIDLIHPKNKEETTKLLTEYLHKQLKISIQNKNVPYELIGFENEDESLWIYIESSECQNPKSLHIENSILCDSQKEQMNIVNIEVSGQKKSWKVNCPEKSMDFQF